MESYKVFCPESQKVTKHFVQYALQDFPEVTEYGI